MDIIEDNVEASNFDLLDFVVNSELPVNDPNFLAVLDDIPTPQALDQDDELVTVDPTEIAIPAAASTSNKQPPKGKKILMKPLVNEASSRPRYNLDRLAFIKLSKLTDNIVNEMRMVNNVNNLINRRSKSRTSKVTTSDHAYMTGAADNIKAEAPEDVEDQKYRRMRDLNNAASKRCRANRKRKQATMQEEEEFLVRRNKELKMKATQMEEMVEKLKAKFIEKVANPQREPLDLDRLMAQRLSSMC